MSKKSFFLFFKGSVLAFSMVLPGLSAGTMAFILGIYKKLILEVSKINTGYIKNSFLFLSLRKKEIKKSLCFFKTSLDWNFFIPLFFGFIIFLIVFIAFAPPLINSHPLEFYSLVFGLVLASLYKPLKEMKKKLKNLSLLFLSFVLNFLFFYLIGKDWINHQREIFPLFFFAVGFLVSMALVIPGISGSYLLILLGLYEKTLEAIRNFEGTVIIFFVIGAISGIFFTVRLMKFFLQKHLDETLAIIIGLILGSLYPLFPLSFESMNNLFSFDIEKQIFLLYFIPSFFSTLALSIFHKPSNF